MGPQRPQRAGGRLPPPGQIVAADGNPTHHVFRAAPGVPRRAERGPPWERRGHKLLTTKGEVIKIGVREQAQLNARGTGQRGHALPLEPLTARGLGLPRAVWASVRVGPTREPPALGGRPGAPRLAGPGPWWRPAVGGAERVPEQCPESRWAPDAGRGLCAPADPRASRQGANGGRAPGGPSARTAPFNSGSPAATRGPSGGTLGGSGASG